MPDHELSRASSTDGLPVAPSMLPVVEREQLPHRGSGVDRRTVFLCALSVGLAFAAGGISRVLTGLIALVTQLSFYGRFSFEPVSPVGHPLGPWVVAVPIAGGLVVGLMARYGSKAIRGHGIPEAMEQVLTNESRIPPRMMVLKPLSAAISIGTGGPFGAEGPIIATGGALGSTVGQYIRMTADERKTLLAAGAAAGMAATFGSPVSAVLLAVELLLFEYRMRSIVPVALATATATAVRMAFEGTRPAFAVTALEQPGAAALALYVLVGALVGVASVGVTRAVYAIEDRFEKLPIHWMWWPALGGLVVGLVGWADPRTLGVGYSNIEDIVSGRVVGLGLMGLVGLKFLSWSISLGSGTSGGTLAPLFTVGSGLGGLLGAGLALVLPAAGVDPKVAALVGMAAMFAGASRSLLASVVFAFETTRQPLGLLPLLGGCSAAYLLSSLLMRDSIMTEKLVRRGVRVVSEYGVDELDRLWVKDHGARKLVTLAASLTVEQVRAWLREKGRDTSHQGFPVVEADGAVVGVLTRRDLLSEGAALTTPLRELVRRAPVVVYEDETLRQAADRMVHFGLGRLVVVSRQRPRHAIGILTRSDLLGAHRARLRAGGAELPSVHPERAAAG